MDEADLISEVALVLLVESIAGLVSIILHMSSSFAFSSHSSTFQSKTSAKYIIARPISHGT